MSVNEKQNIQSVSGLDLVTAEESSKRNFFERIVRLFDWTLFITMVILISVGIAAVYSAASRFGNPAQYYGRQLFAVVLGFIGFIGFVVFNYQIFRQYASVIYGFSIILLVSVLFLGETVRGSRSWFNFHFFSFQPVEIAKLMFILVLAAYLDKYWHHIRQFKTTIIPMLLLFGHVGLVLLQPDFSSSLVYFPILLGMLYAAHAQVQHLASYIIVGSIMGGLPLLYTFLTVQPKFVESHAFIKFIVKSMEGGMASVIVLSSISGLILFFWWFLSKLRIFIPVIYPLILIILIIGGSAGSSIFQKGLKEYQRKRLIVFLNKNIDPLGAGYNITQSEIAIGSGRIVGKGYLSGTQSRLGFLPEQHTDFIFSVIGEEFGFLISFAVLVVYFVVVWRAFAIALQARDRYGSLIASGIGCLFAFYCIINVGMVMGIMPVTGLPFPFISYGGSSLVSSMIAIGILTSIHIRRFTY